MVTLKLVSAIALFMGLSTFAFAGSPKVDAKALTKTEVSDALASSTKDDNSSIITNSDGTYSVTAVNEDPDPPVCSTRDSPCMITSDHELTTGRAPQTDVDSQTNGFSIDSNQLALH